MNFRFSDQEKTFREEVQSWIKNELPADWQGVDHEDQFDGQNWPVTQKMAKRLAAKGWLTLAWPKEYGGQARSTIEQAIFQEEMMYAGVPGLTMGIGGTQWVGPTLMLYGNEEQKAVHLPPIASGDSWWCTGYSEPGSGSDLAALQMRAVRDGDDYVVTGQKAWTSCAHIADWCWLAVRTDTEAPKHKGISILLVDMKSSGVRPQPIVNIANGVSFNEVVFDEVRVPARNLVGEENQGWYVMAVALDFERSGIRFASYSRKLLALIRRFASSATRDGKPLVEHPLVSNLLADLAVQVEVQRHFGYRVAWLQDQKKVPTLEASMAKVYGSELQQRVAQAGMRVLGLYGQLEPGSPLFADAGRIERQYLLTVSLTVAAGTSEIQRNIISQRGLGLPRS